MKVTVYLSCCGGDKIIDLVKEAIRISGIESQMEAVSDIAEVAKAGILSPPAIKVNNRIIVSGRMPKAQDLAALLSKAAKEA